ncbi:MAG: hypothetical protein B1H07_03590 [Campylobacteraceae bacterium 4484_166]|nr:MAG: hypothetical protein B1H07_03590 [Campylobacteraceae bacterium 4484_166]
MRLIILIILLMVSSNGANKIDKIKQNTEKCLENVIATSAMMECLDIEYTARDKELNQTYKKLKKLLNSKTRQALKKAQKQWIITRDEDMKLIDELYMSPKFEGSLYRITRYDDIITLTHKRTIFLQRLINTIAMTTDY